MTRKYIDNTHKLCPVCRILLDVPVWKYCNKKECKDAVYKARKIIKSSNCTVFERSRAQKIINNIK